MDLLGRATGIDLWPIRPADPAMVVHLPGGQAVARRTGEERWNERRRAFPGSEPFWRWQEATADALWDFALRLPHWPPRSPADLEHLASTGLAWLRANRGHLGPRWPSTPCAPWLPTCGLLRKTCASWSTRSS